MQERKGRKKKRYVANIAPLTKTCEGNFFLVIRLEGEYIILASSRWTGIYMRRGESILANDTKVAVCVVREEERIRVRQPQY